MNMTLRELENRSIFLLREAYAHYRGLAMLWSIGKDSTVMLWLARKAFFGHVPFPLIHVDTACKIPEMIAYRDQMVRQWGLELIIGRNDEVLASRQTFSAGAVDRITCCANLKTAALKMAISGKPYRYRLNIATGLVEKDPSSEEFTAIISGIRADEEGSRSKERYFSPRTKSNEWDVALQPPEFWNQYNTDFPSGTHIRIHPLLDWTELNIWQYIEHERIPTVSLYYDQGKGMRYRSLGCQPCTTPISSIARTPGEIVSELSDGQLAHVAERSGRAQDKEDGGGLETLRRGGYM